MAALQTRLSVKANASSSRTFQTILRLSWTEVLVEDEAAAVFHLEMLHYIADTAGCLAKLDSWSTEWLSLRMSISPACSCPSRSLTGPNGHQSHSASSGRVGFSLKQATHSPSHDDTWYCRRTVGCNVRRSEGPERLREYVTTHDVPPNDDIFHWKQLQKSDCDARLVTVYLDNVRLAQPAAPKRQTAPFACIAAIYWSDMIFGHRGRVNVGLRLLRKLKAKLLKEETSGNNPESDRKAELRLWALFVGAFAEEKAPTRGKKGRWHTIRFFMQAPKMRLVGADQIRAVLKHFLLSDPVQRETLRTLVEKFGQLAGGSNGKTE